MALPTLVALVATSLLCGMAGGLLRAGVVLPHAATLVQHAAIAHAALMISGFLGTVISIERAVAVKLKWAFGAPFAASLGGVCWLAGLPDAAIALGIVAAAIFVAVNVVVVRRQRVAHTVVLLLGAVAWLVGNAALARGAGIEGTLPWWFAFLVMTIAAERLEMTRLMRHRPGAQAALFAILGLMLAGALLSGIDVASGGLVYGASLAALAAWLMLFDIARRTVHAHGLSRYMALCLLGGYVWLGVAGFAWAAHALGLPARDTALHALGLGFIVSMVMGHAPVILPAVARVKLWFSALFYAPLALLHGSLVLRLAGGAFDVHWRSVGATLNAIAILAFAATVLAAAFQWHAKQSRH
ncbi:MAG TPA: hypothetical protein VJ743_12975 [Albitalea sp.]|nr:hypothetical protein [Albitalea sp.]